jgi:hypothetical protein
MAIETATAAAIATCDGPRAESFRGLFNVIPFTFTFDEDSIGSGVSAAGDVTVKGAKLGDFVLVAARTDLVDIHLNAFVQSANTVTVTVTDLSGATNTGRNGNETYNGLVLQPVDTWPSS